MSAAGTECCVVVGQLTLRSVHRECAGRVMEPRKSSLQEPTLFQMRKAISLRADDNERKDPAGVGEQGMQTKGVLQEPGRSCRFRSDNPDGEDRKNKPLAHVGQHSFRQGSEETSAERYLRVNKARREEREEVGAIHSTDESREPVLKGP